MPQTSYKKFDIFKIQPTDNLIIFEDLSFNRLYVPKYYGTNLPTYSSYSWSVVVITEKHLTHGLVPLISVVDELDEKPDLLERTRDIQRQVDSLQIPSNILQDYLGKI